MPYQGPIDYKVTGGFFGTGDGTPPLHIEPDGTATRDAAPLTLDSQVVEDLYQKAADARLAMLLPEYNCSCADDYVHVVTVRIDGMPRSIEVHEMASYPDRLKDLLDMLQAIAGER
jgi:hypothetical protein